MKIFHIYPKDDGSFDITQGSSDISMSISGATKVPISGPVAEDILTRGKEEFIFNPATQKIRTKTDKEKKELPVDESVDNTTIKEEEKTSKETK